MIIPKLQTCQKTLYRIEESKSSFRSFRGSKTRKQIPSNPPSKQITPPSWLSLQVTQPQFKNGAATPASHRCRLQRVPKNYSPSIEGVAFSTIPPPSPPSSRVHRERERERMKNCRAYPQPPATRLATIVRTSWEFALPERKTRGARHEGFRCE